MKTEKNILVAFLLNMSFSIFELVGGLFTNSVAILSDAVHDFGDSLSIGVSYFLEKKSKQKPNDKYTYGYVRYSILGAFITTSILIVGSFLVMCGSVVRIVNPVSVNYNGMIVFAVFGVVVNFVAAYFTREGDSINQRSVNLHMLEDVLGWIVVLVGSILMKFTDIGVIDSIMSIGVALFVFVHAFGNFKQILYLFLEKVPNCVSVADLKMDICAIEGVIDVHHLHLWSIDGVNNYATLHVVSDVKDVFALKKSVREVMCHNGISHVTIEVESTDDVCDEVECNLKHGHGQTHHHHH